jgi:hypothetical protein
MASTDRNGHKKEPTMSTRLAISCGLALLAASSLACAEDVNNPWTTTVWVGPDLAAADNLQSSGSATLPDLGVISPTLAGSAGSTSTFQLNYRDAFQTGPGIGFEAAYRATPLFETFARLSYSVLNGRDATVGEISSASLTGPAAIQASFDDLHSTALTFGGRYELLQYGSVRPFLAGYIGATHTSPLSAHISVPEVATDLGSGRLLPGATRLDTGLELGVGYAVNDHTSFRVAVGANYVAAEHRDSDALSLLGYPVLPVHEQRWSVPAMIGVTYRF